MKGNNFYKTYPGLFVIFMALFSVAIHLLVANNLEYNRDEMLYFSLGQHPAFGYASVPPMIGWIAWLLEHTLGYSLFAVRIVPALMSGVMVILVGAIAGELGGSSYARVLAGVGFIIAAFALRTFSEYMPVFIDVVFWSIIIYLIIRYVNTYSGITLILLGFEDGSIHSLPQDYADMLGWEELTQVTSKAYEQIEDKKAAIIFGDNYGEAGAINIIGKKYGLPDPISFSESFQYWVPKRFDPDITSVVYIHHGPPGEDVKSLFWKITVIGSITNPDSREFGLTVYLCQDPDQSFNEFWTARLKKFYETGR